VHSKCCKKKEEGNLGGGKEKWTLLLDLKSQVAHEKKERVEIAHEEQGSDIELREN